MVGATVSCSMFTAIGSVQRAHPFGSLFVLERGDGLEIRASDGIKLHGGFVVSNFFDGGGEMDDGIVFARHGGMTGSALGDDVHIRRNFFADLHADVLRLAVLEENAAAFVDGVAGGDFV